MKTTILKTTTVLAGLVLLQGCSWEMIERINSCPNPELDNCGMSTQEYNERRDSMSTYEDRLAEWQQCKSDEAAGLAVYCGMRPTMY